MFYEQELLTVVKPSLCNYMTVLVLALLFVILLNLHVFTWPVRGHQKCQEMGRPQINMQRGVTSCSMNVSSTNDHFTLESWPLMREDGVLIAPMFYTPSGRLHLAQCVCVCDYALEEIGRAHV